MNRRLPIFVVVFLTVCLAGFGYTYSIAPTYVATAMIQVDPGTSPNEVQKGAAFVANEAQALNSNEMLETVLATRSRKHPAFSGFDSVARLREALAASASSGTNVIQLQARGSEPAQLVEVLDVWAAVYLQSRGTRRTVDRGASIDEARRTVESAEGRVAQRRRELDEFRRRHSIVSPEREENEVAAQVKSLTGALNDARTKAIDAESRSSAVKASLADGKPVYRAPDRATIAQLEQRLLDLRQRLKDLELRFTPQYLAMEPSVKVMHANMRQLEQQIEEKRRSSEQAMLNEAAQDLVTVQKNVARLEAQFAERRKDALNFTSRFAEHKAQTMELLQLEAQLSQAKQRLALLERSERTQEPKYELLGRPVMPEKPVHPDYVRYAGYTVGSALLAALLAVLLVEFLNPRPKPDAPAYQPIIQIAYPSLAGGRSGETFRLVNEVGYQAPPRQVPAALEAPQRELSVPEVHALWEAATSDARLVVAAVFSGLTLGEVAALTWNDVDLKAKVLQVMGPAHRVHPLTPPLTQELQARQAGRGGAAVAVTSADLTLSVADLEGLVAAAAHDAGLDQAASINAETLRHTYISFLVRQGARLSELEQLVGPVPPASFLHYRSLSPRGPGAPLSALERVFPVFRTA